MLRKLLLFVLALLALPAAAQSIYSATDPLAHTFSIVARRLEAGELAGAPAITLANEQQVPAALVLLKPIFRQAPHWRMLTARLPKVGLLTVAAAEPKQILALK